MWVRPGPRRMQFPPQDAQVLVCAFMKVDVDIMSSYMIPLEHHPLPRVVLTQASASECSLFPADVDKEI